MTFIGTTVPILLFLFSLFHFYWMFGGRWGYSIVFPRHKGRDLFRPGPPGLFLIGSLLALSGFVMLGQTGMLTLSLFKSYYPVATIMVGALAALRAIGDFRYLGFFKSERSHPCSRVDTWVLCPLCAYISWVCFYLATR